MRKMKVVLAGKYPEHTYDNLRKLLPHEKFNIVEVNTQEVYDTMTCAEIMMLRIFKAPKEVIGRSKNLKMILRWGTGFDSVDMETADKHGVLVTNTPGANAGAVSELAVLLMLAAGRRLMCREDCLRRGEWSKNIFINSSHTLNNKVVGIVGAGNTGRQVARKVHAFGASTQYYDPYRLTPAMEEEFRLKFTSLDEVLRTSDIITLHVPLTDENKHMINAGNIAEMKDGAIIINTAIGGLIDDHALAVAVKSGSFQEPGLTVWSANRYSLTTNYSQLRTSLLRLM